MAAEEVKNEMNPEELILSNGDEIKSTPSVEQIPTRPWLGDDDKLRLILAKLPAGDIKTLIKAIHNPGSSIPVVLDYIKNHKQPTPSYLRILSRNWKLHSPVPAVTEAPKTVSKPPGRDTEISFLEPQLLSKFRFEVKVPTLKEVQRAEKV